MGLTIKSKNFEMDLGYIGFNELRKTVAKLISSEFGEHYANLEKARNIFNDSERNIFLFQYSC